MLSKIKEIGIKHEKIVILIFIAIAVVTFSFNVQLTATDELWNFSNIYKMANGYTIYKDLNVIITPLFFYIGEIIFEIFGRNYLVFRIYNVVIFSTFYFLIYKVFQTLEIKTERNIFYLIIIYSITYYIIMTGANYNILALNFCLIGILLILKQKPSWLQGIIIFLVFMTKQNIGIYYAIGYIIYQWIQHKKIKETIKKSIPSGLIAMGLLGVYLIYLWTNQNLYNFINYAFLGIAEFGTKNLGYDRAIYTLVLVILAYPVIIWMLKSKQFTIPTDVKQRSYVLISFAIPSLLTAYPLINEYHVDFAIILSVITFIYVIEKSFLEELTSQKLVQNIIRAIIATCIVGIILLCFYENIPYCIAMQDYDYYDMYYGVVVKKEVKEDINQMIEYIIQNESKGKKVIILSYYSNLYMNPLNRNNGKMDLPFHGNLGKEGEDGLIREIDSLQNTNLLILKEKDTVFQESEKARQHIIDTYEPIGEIGLFRIYKVGY